MWNLKNTWHIAKYEAIREWTKGAGKIVMWVTCSSIRITAKQAIDYTD
jgi:hypothetical protein